MSPSRAWFASSIVIVAGLGAPRAAAEEYSIGTYGVVVELGSAFERRQTDVTLGADQFRAKRGPALVFGAFVECGVVVDGEAAHRRMMDSVAENLAAMSLEVEVEEPFGYSTDDGIQVSRALYRTTEKGLPFAREVRVISSACRGYLLITWSQRNFSSFLTEVADDLVDGMRFPPLESAAGKPFVPAPWSFEVTQNDVTFDAAPGVFKVSNQGGQASLALESAATDIRIFAFGVRGESRDAVLAKVAAAIGASLEDGGSEPVRERTIGGRPAQSAVLVEPTDATKFVDCTVVEIEPGLYVDFRIGYSGPREVLADLRRAIVESIRITPLPQLDLELAATPVVPASSEFPALMELLGSARRIRTLTEAPSDFARGRDGAWILSTGTGALRSAPPFAHAETLLEGRESRSVRFACRFGDAIVTLDPGGCVVVEDGRTVPAPMEFVACVEAGVDEIVGVGAQDPGTKIPVDLAPTTRTPLRVVRWRVGERPQVVARLPAGSIGDVALDPDGRHLYVGCSIESASPHVKMELLRVDLTTGTHEPVGDWSAIGELVTTDGGILAAGKSREGRSGVYRIGADGSIEFALGGLGLLAVGEVGGELFVSTELGDHGEPAAVRSIVAVDSARAALVARSCVAPSSHELSRIGGEALGDLAAEPWRVFADRAAFDSFLARAEESARAQGLPPLPATAEQVDGFFRTRVDSEPMNDSGVILLAALIGRALLDGGGAVEFVPTTSGRSWMGLTRREVYPGESEFTIAADLLEFAAANVAPAASWRGVEPLRKYSESKRLVIGVDPAALRAECERGADPDFFARLAAAIEGPDDPSRFDSVFSSVVAHHANTGLRRRVYDQLVAAGEFVAVERLARMSLAVDATHLEIDSAAAARAALSNLGSALPTEALIAEIRAAVEANPSSVRLWISLGDAYARAQVADARTLARFAYREASARDSDGVWSAEIERGLASVTD